MIAPQPGKDLRMRTRTASFVLVWLAAAGCNAGSPASPGFDGAPGDGGVPSPEAAAPDGGPEAATDDAGEDAGGSDADAEAGYAVCPEAMDATFGSIYGEILSPEAGSCGAVGFGCHSTIGARTAGSKLDFSLDASAVYAELLGDGGGYPATNAAGDAGHVVLRVAPGDAGASMLYIKLTLTQGSPLYGAGMPLYTPGSICPPALEAIKQWIDTGAAR
jgi:hypothetical protein